MHYKFKTLEWWSISIYFFLWGLLSVLIISSRPIPPINWLILALGTLLMIYCAWKEDELFPDEPQGEEET